MIKYKKGIKTNPFALMGLLLVMWGSFSAVSKLSLERLDNFQLLFFIFGLAITIMTIIVCINGKLSELKEISSKDLIKLTIYSYHHSYIIFYTPWR